MFYNTKMDFLSLYLTFILHENNLIFSSHSIFCPTEKSV